MWRKQRKHITQTKLCHSEFKSSDSAHIWHTTGTLTSCFPDLPKISVFTCLYIQEVVKGRACICAEQQEKVNQPLCLRLNLRIAAQSSCNRARLPLRLSAHYHRTAPKEPPPPITSTSPLSARPHPWDGAFTLHTVMHNYVNTHLLLWAVNLANLLYFNVSFLLPPSCQTSDPAFFLLKPPKTTPHTLPSTASVPLCPLAGWLLSAPFLIWTFLMRIPHLNLFCFPT